MDEVKNNSKSPYLFAHIKTGSLFNATVEVIAIQAITYKRRDLPPLSCSLSESYLHVQRVLQQ